MAISIAGITAGGALGTLTFAHEVKFGGRRYLIVGVATRDNDGLTRHYTSVTYGGVAMTQLGSNGDAYRQSAMWGLLNPAVGTANVVCTRASSWQGYAEAINLYGVDQSTPYGTVVDAGGVSTTPTVNASTVLGDLVIDNVMFNASQTISVGAGQTQIHNNNAQWPTLAGSYEAGTGGAVTMSWTATGSVTWSIVAAPFHAATVGGNQIIMVA